MRKWIDEMLTGEKGIADLLLVALIAFTVALLIGSGRLLVQ